MQAKRIGEMLRQIGASNSKSDTLLAHITPEEAALLKRRGGSGRIDPDTGLPHFEAGSDNNDSATGDTNSGSDQSTYSNPSDDNNSHAESAPPGPDQNEDGTFNPNAFADPTGSNNQNSWYDPNTGLWNYDVGNMLGMGMSMYNPNNQSNQESTSADQSYSPAAQNKAEWGLTQAPDEISGLEGYNFSGNFGPASRSEYSGISARGDFDNYITNYGNDWGVNWGAIGHDLVGAMNSAPGVAIGTALFGPAYNLAAKGANIGLNAYADAATGRGYQGTQTAALNSLGSIGGSLFGPTGAVIGGTVGQAAQGNWGNALGNLASYALAGNGLDQALGQKGAEQFGTIGGFIGAKAGSLAQDYAVSQALSALGITNGMTASGSLSGSAFDATPSSSTDYTTLSLDASTSPSVADTSSTGYGTYTAGQQLGSSGGSADLGSVYLQKIKDLYKNQTGAFEEQKRKTWYRDDNTMGGLTGSPWRRI